MTLAKIACLGAMSSIVVFGCASNDNNRGAQTPSSATGDLTMTIAFDPSPPKQGSETVTISLHDASGGAAKGAIVRIATKMPDMGMTGPTMSAQDNGDGTYSAVANVNYQTKWVFDVTASAGGKSSSAKFVESLK